MNEQQQILKILHDSLFTKLSLIESQKSPIKITEFCSKLLKCLKSQEYQVSITLGPIVFIVDSKKSGKGICMLEPNNLNDFLLSGKIKTTNILYIDYDGHEILPSLYEIENLKKLDEVSNASSKNNSLIYIFVDGNNLLFFKDGSIIEDICDIFSVNRTRSFIYRLPICEYRTLIKRHFNEVLVGQRASIYWQNKKERILIAAPEKHFRKSLAYYLERNVSDGRILEESPNANTDDKTDICVLTFVEGNVYIFEIKWIGKSVGSEYNGAKAHTRANEGIRQIHNYLEVEYRCNQAALLIYDARIKKEEIKWNNPSKWDKRIDKNPMVLYLESKSASKKASIKN